MLAANIESPIVVVLSGNSYIQGSMEPAYYRGDILFVTNWKKRVDPGDVIVF
jgi:signal peptidase